MHYAVKRISLKMQQPHFTLILDFCGFAWLSSDSFYDNKVLFCFARRRPLRADEKLPVRRHRETLSPPPAVAGGGEGDNTEDVKNHKSKHKSKHKVCTNVATDCSLLTPEYVSLSISYSVEFVLVCVEGQTSSSPPSSPQEEGGGKFAG